MAGSPLSAQQLEAIRATGRAVLQSQKNATEAPEVVSLREEVHALKSEIDAALVLSPTTLTLHGKSAALPTANPQPKTNLQAHDAAIRSHLDTIKTHRTRLQHRIDSAGSSSIAARHHADITRNLAALEADISSALAVQDSLERFKRLTAIRDRLQPQSLRERNEIAARDGNSQAVTPTIVTITQHR